ncbi:MAG: phosphopantetheine-binding protein, partial [Flavobacteriales bacterium]|nr:phosphopantetheine-binding protein [Flavobacteriales bacterium]
MEEWRDSTVDRISHLNPRTILEIGSGTGLLTFPLVKKCESYIGADFSSVAVEKLDHALRSLGIENASILLAKADEVFDVKAVKEKRIDTIILNSITQYFPSAEYLDNILMESIEILNPGQIFIGDIRDYRLLDVLHFSIETYKITQDALEVDVSTLQNSIKMHVKKESELLLSPAYFLDLAKRNQKIDMVEILPKRGVCDNELNGFRYDVIIHVHQKDMNKAGLPLTEKNEDNFALEYENNLNILDFLKSHHSSLIIKGYPNKRVWKDYQLKQELDNLEPSEIYHQDARYIGEYDSILSLEGLHSTAKQHGYSLYCHLAIEQEESSSKFDLYFYKDQSELDLHKRTIFQNYLNEYYQTKLSNNPEINNQRRSVDVANVRESLLNNLPEYMIPSLFIELAEMPLSPNGKIDRKALPKPEGREGLAAYQAPEGLIENGLATIWKELLQVERVGRNDNFFHLGGHSLIATRLISKIRQSESVEVPLRVIFDHPVLCDLAQVIEEEYQSAGVLPPITRVKRDGLLPLSFAQQRLWFIEQLLANNNGLYHIPTVIRIKGDLNEKALK